MRISDGSSDVGSSDLRSALPRALRPVTYSTAIVPTGSIRRTAVQDAGIAAVCNRMAGTSFDDWRRRLVQDRHWPILIAHGRANESRGKFCGGAERGRVRARGVRSAGIARRSEEHTSELQSLMRISYAVFCL